MKTIRPHVWAAIFVALGVVGLCVFYPAQTKRVDVSLPTPSTEQHQPTQARVNAAEPVTAPVTADPKADERARMLASLGFGNAGGHKVSVNFTNSSPRTVAAQ